MMQRTRPSPTYFKRLNFGTKPGPLRQRWGAMERFGGARGKIIAIWVLVGRGVRLSE
jgi:hypothetical protein